MPLAIRTYGVQRSSGGPGQYKSDDDGIVVCNFPKLNIKMPPSKFDNGPDERLNY